MVFVWIISGFSRLVLCFLPHWVSPNLGFPTPDSDLPRSGANNIFAAFMGFRSRVSRICLSLASYARYGREGLPIAGLFSFRRLLLL